MSSLRLYKSYNFVDKDPIIYKLRDMVESDKITYAEIERRSGVSATTLWNWFYGKTKRPQHASLRAVLRALGRDLAIVDEVQALSNSANAEAERKPTKRRRKRPAWDYSKKKPSKGPNLQHVRGLH